MFASPLKSQKVAFLDLGSLQLCLGHIPSRPLPAQPNDKLGRMMIIIAERFWRATG